MLKQKNAVIDFLTAFFMLCIAYRASLLLNQSFYRFLIDPTVAHVSILTGIVDDIVIGAVLCSVLWMMRFILKILRIKIFQTIAECCLYFLLLAFTLIYYTHEKLYSTVAIGFTWNGLVDSFRNGLTPIHYIDFMNRWDFVFIIAPMIIFFILRKISQEIVVGIFVLTVAIVLGGFYYGSYLLNRNPLVSGNIILFFNPVGYAIREAACHNNAYLHRMDKPQRSQFRSVQLIDPLFINQQLTAAPVKLIPTHKKNWNIVFLVLESVGSRYIFNPAENGKIPMPSLQHLAQQGVYFSNHYSSGNCSPLAEFGLLSGIYPNPTPYHFEMEKNIFIPHIANWVNKNYDSFFVISGNTKYYFVKGFLQNGFKEYDDPSNIPLPYRKYNQEGSRLLEPMGFQFFLSRLNQAKPPFLAVYWSAAAHFPYDDYGPSTHLMPNDSNYHRYLNNLFLLDHEIEQAVNLVRTKGLLNDTLFIIVGDHGEGFGQHHDSGSYMHGRALYEEIIRSPWVMYQPTLFKPQVVHQLTSHVDVLPTLLDILHVSFNPQLFQGHSLVKAEPQRKYIFVYGDEDSLATITPQGIKTKISFSEGKCYFYNLTNDANEKHPKSCRDDRPVIAFRNFQPALLQWYNATQKSEMGFIK